MPTRAFHRSLITGRIAHFCGLLWMVLFAAQWAIAIHDELVFPESAVNYQTLDRSAAVSLWLLLGIAALNLWATALRGWWRGDPPPHLGWLVTYNVRVAVVWAIGVSIHSVLLRTSGLPGHTWLVGHLSLGYAISCSGSVFGLALLVSRRWGKREPKAGETASAGSQKDTYL